MASMDKETEEYYNRYFDLFTHDGWKQLVEELKQNASIINSVENTKDEEDLYIRKGQLKVLAYLLNFQSNLEHSFEELKKKMKIFVSQSRSSTVSRFPESALNDLSKTPSYSVGR